MKYLSLYQVPELYRQLIALSGGAFGIRDLPALESAIAQPYMSFENVDLYPSLPEKAAALAFSPINNHPFIDGNKRIAHASMEVFLFINGHEIKASVDEQEKLFLALASGDIQRDELSDWIKQHLIQLITK